MVTPEMGNRLPGHGYFAIDNGCFSKPHAFRWEKYAAKVERMLREAGDRCLFATAPDIPFDADGTLARFDEYLPRMKATGARIALVTQDGMQTEDIRWNDIDALFVGGSTAWKTGYESSVLIAEARRRGKWVHMGRVNSLKRINAARSMGCDSADGTYLKYGPNVNWPHLLSWFNEIETRPMMVLA